MQCSLAQRKLSVEGVRVKSVSFPPDHFSSTNSACAAPTGDLTRLIVTYYNGEAQVWRVHNRVEATSAQTSTGPAPELDALYSLGGQVSRCVTLVGQPGQDGDLRVCLGCDDGFVYVSRDQLPPLNGSAPAKPVSGLSGCHAEDMLKVEVSPGNYVRSLASHPLQNGFFTASNDGSVKMFIYDNSADDYICEKSHNKHFLMAMQVVVAPVGPQKFLKVCSVAQDMKIVFWYPESDKFDIFENKHSSGINCVAFHPDSTKSLMLTGGDDNTVNVWNYSNDTVLKRITCFTEPLTAVAFSLSQQLILAAAEDGAVRAFKEHNFKEVLYFKPDKEKLTRYQQMGRVWCFAENKEGLFAVGYDNGMDLYDFVKSNTFHQIDSRMKLFYCCGKKVMQQNLSTVKNFSQEEFSNLQSKTVGICEFDDIFGMTLSPNGKYIVLKSGKEDFTVYSSLALRSQFSSKSSLKPIFSSQSDMLFMTESKKLVVQSNNFKSRSEINLNFEPEKIFAGPLIGLVNSENDETVFYIQSSPPVIFTSIPLLINNIFWNENGNYAILATESKSYLVAFGVDEPEIKSESKIPRQSYKIISKFNFFPQSCLFTSKYLLFKVNSAVECIYFQPTSSIPIKEDLDSTQILSHVEGRLQFMPSESKIVTLMFNSTDSPVYNVYEVNFDLLKFKHSVLSQNNENCQEIFKNLSVNHKESALDFLDKNGKLDLIYDALDDKTQRGEIALKLNYLQDALDLATSESQLEKILVRAVEQKETEIALKVLGKMQSPNLSLQLLLILSNATLNAESSNEKTKSERLDNFADHAKQLGEINLSFIANLHSGNKEKALECLKEQNLFPEAAFFARSYLPTHVDQSVTDWKESLKANGKNKASIMVGTRKNFPEFFE